MITSPQTSSFSLMNKVILVTGASSGIGAAVAKALAVEGALVILLGRHQDALLAVYDEICQMAPQTPMLCPFNLATAQLSDYETLVESVEQRWQRLDGVLFNAAHLGSLTPIEYYDIAEWYEVLQVNLNSSFILVRLLAPLLKAAAAARVVFTLDQSIETTPAFYGAYGVSKAGTLSLVRSLAAEWHNTSIRVNAVVPKPSDTPLRRRAFPAGVADTWCEPAHNLPTYLQLFAASSEHHGEILSVDS